MGNRAERLKDDKRPSCSVFKWMTLVPWRSQYNQLCQKVRSNIYILLPELVRGKLIFYTFLGLIWILIFDSLLMAKHLGVTIGDNTLFPCLIFKYEDRNAVPIAWGLTWPPWRSVLESDQITSSPDWKNRIVWLQWSPIVLVYLAQKITSAYIV